jgi:hypothetical protein
LSAVLIVSDGEGLVNKTKKRKKPEKLNPNQQKNYFKTIFNLKKSGTKQTKSNYQGLIIRDSISSP